MEIRNTYHGHTVVQTFDEDGWHYELFAPDGKSLGARPTLAACVREAKDRSRAAPDTTPTTPGGEE